MRATQHKYLRITAAIFLVVFVATICGCNDEETIPPGKLTVFSGDEQCAPTGQPLPKDFLIKVVSDSGDPVRGARVQFEISGAPGGAVLTSDESADSLRATRIVDVSDAGGMARARLIVGYQPGDLEVHVSLPDFPNVKNVILRTSAGMELTIGDKDISTSDGNKLCEGRAGHVLEYPLAITVTGEDGEPRIDTPVYFRIENAPNGTKLVGAELRTDTHGRAETRVKMGKGTGRVVITAAVGGYQRAARFELFCLDPWKIAMVVIGGLALFIMGMRIMSDGLTRVAGKRMRAILQSFTRNRVFCVLVGAGITAIIQSSSATSVMVVGFVNAGLLRLQQAIALVLGATIGTTVTAQMIAFKLTAVALPAVAIGVSLQIISKRKTTQNWGLVLAGFGILFTGLATMSGVLKGLQYSPTITGLFSSIDCTPVAGHIPVGAVLLSIGIGTLVTIIVQSSSASIGLLQVLAATGLLNFYTAFPILLGDNIGTTTTALLASIGTNRNARRAAVAHSLIKCFGTIMMFMIFFISWGGHPIFLHIVNKITMGDAFAGENLSRHIANAHTIFNVWDAIFFLPLIPVLAWICRKLVPETAEEKEEKPRYLEPYLLDTPTLALDRARNELTFMTKLSRKAIDENFSSFIAGKVPDRDLLDRREERIDTLQRDITDYLMQLSQRGLLEHQSRQLPQFMHAVNDAERIGDHAENLLELAEQKLESKLTFSDEGKHDLTELYEEVEIMFGHTIELLEDQNEAAGERALRCEDRINAFSKELEQRHVARLEKGACNLISGIVFLDMVANLEKVADHLTNIAEAGQIIMAARKGE